MIIELEMVLKRPSASADSGLTARGIWPGKGRKKEEWLWRYILEPDKKISPAAGFIFRYTRESLVCFAKILQALLHHRRELGVGVAVGIRSPQNIIRERSDVLGVLSLQRSEALVKRRCTHSPTRISLSGAR